MESSCRTMSGHFWKWSDTLSDHFPKLIFVSDLWTSSTPRHTLPIEHTTWVMTNVYLAYYDASVAHCTVSGHGSNPIQDIQVFFFLQFAG